MDEIRYTLQDVQFPQLLAVNAIIRFEEENTTHGGQIPGL